MAKLRQDSLAANCHKTSSAAALVPGAGRERAPWLLEIEAVLASRDGPERSSRLPPPQRSLARNIFPSKARFGIAGFSASPAPPQQLHFRCDHCCDHGEPPI
jgi:hypothetical protein